MGLAVVKDQVIHSVFLRIKKDEHVQGLCRIQGLFKDSKDSPTVFKDYKLVKVTNLHVKNLIPNC